jgi:hypothetical protein
MYQRSTNQIPMTSRRSVTANLRSGSPNPLPPLKVLATTNTVSSVNLTTAEGDVVKLAEMFTKDELICSLIFLLARDRARVGESTSPDNVSQLWRQILEIGEVGQCLWLWGCRWQIANCSGSKLLTKWGLWVPRSQLRWQWNAQDSESQISIGDWRLNPHSERRLRWILRLLLIRGWWLRLVVEIGG